MTSLVTWLCRQSVRIIRKLHFVLTCTSVVLMIFICMYALDDQTIEQSRKQLDTNRMTTPSWCDRLVHFRRDVPIVWIGGVPRSGTTLMRAMLDAHPDIVCGAESRVIPRMLALHQSMERSEQEMAWLTSARVSNETLDRALGAYLLTIVTRHSFTDDVITGQPEAGAGNRLLCNKDPFTLRSMQRLLRIFPSSLFILLVRDGRAVADSIISGHVTIRGFDVTSHRGALADWNRVMSTMYSQCMAVGAERCLPVHYEQLVLKPEEEMKKVLSFVGLRWNDLVLHHESAINRQNGVFLSRLVGETRCDSRCIFFSILLNNALQV